jgi:hypothetical protein
MRCFHVAVGVLRSSYERHTHARLLRPDVYSLGLVPTLVTILDETPLRLREHRYLLSLFHGDAHLIDIEADDELPSPRLEIQQFAQTAAETAGVGVLVVAAEVFR